MRRATLLTLLLGTVLLTSCHNDPPIVGAPMSQNDDYKENMINANRTIAQSEETSISEYVARRGWEMQKLSNGVRVWEYASGAGQKVDYEDSVTVVYSVEAINGTLIYTQEEETFVAGRKPQMVGLDDAVLTLHYGSRAKVILPSHLAYGIAGDGDRIPSSAILVLDVSVSKPEQITNYKSTQ